MLGCLCLTTCFLHFLLPVFIGIVAVIFKIFLKYPGQTFSADNPKAVRLNSSSPRPLDSYILLDSVPLCVAFLPASEGYLLNFERA